MTMDQQAALERQRALYREKNAHLRQYLEPVDPFEFYREIFPEGSFERKGHYEDAKGNAIALTVPKKQNSRENGVALEIEGDGRARRHLITDELQELGEIQDTDFTIMSPISYFGRQRSGKNARYLYAIVFDYAGNNHIFPIPTAEPIQAIINPLLDLKLSLAILISCFKYLYFT